jgi:Gpi18-like mannosyltransferase
MFGWNRSFIRFPRIVPSLILAGFLIRLPFIPLIGFEQDFLFFTSWASYLADHGVIRIYDDPSQLQFGFVNYPPLYLYVLAFLARMYRWLIGGALETRLFLILIKLATVGFEILIALILYRIGELLKDEKTGIMALALFYCNPAVFYVSVYYGQVDAVFSAFLLISFYLMMKDSHLWAGCFAACALLTKIQSIPFIPFLLFIPIAKRTPRKLLPLAAGFLLAALFILSPYLFSGRLGLVYENSVKGSLEWGKYVTVGAFNMWYLHADPITLDYRMWGWLFGRDGMLHANFFVQWLTYKNLGVALFGAAFVVTLVGFWKRRSMDGMLLAAAHVSLAFFMLPTKVHERYLFPFFLFYAFFAATNPFRMIVFTVFSLCYLFNLMAICPFLGNPRPVEAIDSSMGVMVAACAVLFYVLFVAYEYIAPQRPERSVFILGKVFLVMIVSLYFVLWLRQNERQADPHVIHLSALTPVSFQQDWPENDGTDAKKVIGHDLSVEKRELRIGNTYYRYGLGAHANSTIEYEIPGKYNLLECFLGVDHETMPLFEQYPGLATVLFEIYVNDVKRYQSPLTIPTTPPRKLTLPLPKTETTTRLKLVVKDAGFRNGDHANWALARVIETF